ncbi:methyltransferase family protein [Chryseobacterium luquanense]|uniref:Isoprenylcysteine carboxylmethyltransferase family protein n=1 Tax=Chryseobacterium luquanense TaxID=2983766 RepID=A0ABT3Y320_9FLAO|nr:isoprenylcysteine carboxylmethyltransferase family protein [Chryseobacterium luquanense]MCX8532553.1 isoprenylcysteine carboxylmethyltransferase family protein [Chryseobacterium luquanense]
MTDFIRVFTPLFFIVFFLTAFFGTSFIVSKRIGKNPNVLPKDDSAYGLIGKYFKIALFLLFVYMILLLIFPQDISLKFNISLLRNNIFKYFGMSLMVLSLIWVLIAQFQMKNSWRIGIDEELKTELITTGLFKYSRNPIFFGMLLSLIGLFFTLPTLISLIFFVVSNILIQTQIRLEEDFLLNQHGKDYLQYKAKVRRFL